MEIAHTNVKICLTILGNEQTFQFCLRAWGASLEIKQEMYELSNNKCGGGCVALLKFKFRFYTLTLVKHAGLFAEAGHKKYIYKIYKNDIFSMT